MLKRISIILACLLAVNLLFIPTASAKSDKNIDTDGDGIFDADEIKNYHTDPNTADTDGDGATDGWEIAHGFNPRQYDESFAMSLTEGSIGDGRVKVSVHAKLSGVNAKTFALTDASDGVFFDSNIPGYIDAPYRVLADGIIGKAQLSFEFSSELFDDTSIVPQIYYWDETLQLFLEVPTTVVDNMASAEVAKLGIYELIDKTAFDKVRIQKLTPREAELLLDTDGDGIPDYYELKINEGTLRLGSGRTLTGEAKMTIDNIDSDRDGIPDGEEISIATYELDGKTRTITYVKMKSSPVRASTFYGVPDNASADERTVGYIKELSAFAEKYSKVSDVASGWYVAMYIRHFNVNYRTREWSAVGGKFDYDFISLVKAKYGRIYEHFKNTTELYDNDFHHFGAALSTQYYDSGYEDGGMAYTLPEIHIDNMASWGGDLQTLVCDVFRQLAKSKTTADYDTLYKITYELMGDPKFRFADDDLLADIDAVNLGALTATKAIGEVIEEYYATEQYQRYLDFVAQQTRMSSPTEADLYKVALTYTSYMFAHVRVWPLYERELPGLGIKEITDSLAEAFAKAFARYIWERFEA
jgi:hypothetical protein